MARKPQEINISFIAKQAGVSPGTVSRVINRKNGVGEATRDKVMTLLDQYNFHPNYTAPKSLKIAVLVPYFDLTAYFRRSLNEIYKYAQHNKLIINVIVAESFAQESLLQIVREYESSGVIAFISGSYQRELYDIAETELPVVAIDTVLEGGNIGYITNDSYSGACSATRHLIELKHKKIGYISTGATAFDPVQRLKGFENTMKTSGIEINPDWIYKANSDDNNRIREKVGYECTLDLLKKSPELTAIMLESDLMAPGVLKAIHEIGLKIPEDISILGFDNYPESAYWYPALTTVNHPLEKESLMAIECIHKYLCDPTEKWQPAREILPTELVVRESTGPAKK